MFLVHYYITVMASLIKHLASGSRRRFAECGFDLDLTYIKPNIIVMGFPSEGLEGMYRNHMDEVVRYMDERHCDHYKVYNLCSERSYDPSKFHQRVTAYPFENENAPPFELIEPCCEDLDEWLKADERNVAVIHCHDGLGRTGVMACSYLLHDRLFDSTEDALQFFGEARTEDARGVTLPSQRRYVNYYGYLLKNNMVYSPKTVLLQGFRLIGIPSIQGGTCAPYFTVELQKVKIYTSKVYEDIKKTNNIAEILLPQELPLCGDAKIEFYHQSRVGKQKLFSIWFNTFFIEMHLQQQRLDQFMYRKTYTQSKNFKIALKEAGKQAGVDITTGVTALFSRPLEGSNKVIIFPKSELDKANKDEKRYPYNFQVHMHLSVIRTRDHELV